MPTYPDSKDEGGWWWFTLDENAGLIRDIVIRVRPRDTESPLLFDRLRKARDGLGMYNLLHSVYIEAPDLPIIHSWRGWSTLCELLTEGECVAGRERWEQGTSEVVTHVLGAYDPLPGVPDTYVRKPADDTPGDGPDQRSKPRT